VINIVVCSSDGIIHERFLTESNSNYFNVIKHLTFDSKEISNVVNLRMSDVIDLSNLNRELLEGNLEEYLYLNNMDFIQTNQNVENILLIMMNRIDVHKNLSYIDRRNIYYKLIGYWIKFFKENDIDMVFFSGIPHEVSDYGLFIVSEYLKIKTVILNPVHLFSRVMISTNYKSPYYNQKFQKLYDELNLMESINFEAIFNNHLNFEKNVDVIDRLSKWKRDKKKINWGFKGVNFFNFVWRLFRGVKTLESSKITQYKRLFGTKSFLINIVKYLTYLNSFLQINLEVSILNSEYEEFKKSEIDSDLNYVLFYLHFEPECTTIPMGGFFGNQEMVISTIATNLPKNWKIIVKEHPFQISNVSGYAHLGREAGFYKRLSEFPNLILLDHSVDSFKILQNARAVATITGTLGWEAHILGKPVLVFGDVWYDGLSNIYRVTKTKDIIKVLSLISEEVVTSPFKVDNLQELRETIVEIHKKSFNFSYSKKQCEHLGITWDESQIRIKLDKIIKFISVNHQSIFN
jgi:hypothetical protein